MHNLAEREQISFPQQGWMQEDAAGMGLSGGPRNREVLSALLGRLRPHAGPVAIRMQ